MIIIIKIIKNYIYLNFMNVIGLFLMFIRFLVVNVDKVVILVGINVYG